MSHIQRAEWPANPYLRRTKSPRCSAVYALKTVVPAPPGVGAGAKRISSDFVRRLGSTLRKNSGSSQAW
jgi:hypothetical protein